MIVDMEKEQKTGARAAALEFLRQHKAGVLATVSPEGQPHASAVYYICDEKFNIYFLTLISSRKYAAIKANPKVAFVVGAQDVPQTVQLEGEAEELLFEGEKKELVSNLTKVLTSNTHYYAPVTQLDKAEVVLMWIKPHWVRWADYAAFKEGNENVWTEIAV